MGYCSEIPVTCQRENCAHAPCDHDSTNIHPCMVNSCSCTAFVFPEGMYESQFQGGGGSSGGGGASGSW